MDLSGAITAKDESVPGYFDPLPNLPKGIAQVQWDWIEAQMKASTANYLLVAGHYPVPHAIAFNLIASMEWF